ncbi:PH domain-containing protein [Egicoccus sp. AB-alg2]|uniref:PH domain-containing protein n=1 Tax=Egicoccus sp. AB-alg2 TaxID=3242693 RepID=UPI00359EE244
MPLDDRERRLDPRIVQVWRVGNGIGALFVLGPPAVFAPLLFGRWGYVITVLAAALALAWIVAWPRAQYRRWRWQLTDLALELRHGVVVRRHQAVPYFRIQQIDVAQGPVDRLLGLATLQVTTASASGSAALPGIPADDAPGIRVELLARAAEAVGEHEGELRDAV